jgi:hypothetical protein
MKTERGDKKYQMKGSNPAKTDRAKANASATRAVPLAQLDVIDSDRRRRLPGPPFLAVQLSRNGPVRLGQRFAQSLHFLD